MRILSQRTERFALAGVSVALGALGWALWRWFDEHGLVAFLLGAVSLILFVVLEDRAAAVRRYYDLVHHGHTHYRQLEALMSVIAAIGPRAPLPRSRGFAASPDFLRLIVETIMDLRPKVIVEASSGLSTVIAAYCLKQLGSGVVVSLENDGEYAERTRRQLIRHGLADIAHVIHAPLVATPIRGQDWMWYDTRDLELDGPIDLLIVDGPPATVQALARYPALPVLSGRLSESAVIIMDDAVRDDERKIARRWREEFAPLTQEYLDLEKGAIVLRRSNGRSQDEKASEKTSRSAT